MSKGEAAKPRGIKLACRQAGVDLTKNIQIVTDEKIFYFIIFIIFRFLGSRY